MTARLSKQQRQALTRHPGQPLLVEDPKTHRQYLLVGRDVYEALHQLAQLAEATNEPPTLPETSPTTLPGWCKVYDGLSDQEIEEIENVTRQRVDLTRQP